MTQPAVAPVRVLVYGSCVARDTVELIDDTSIDLRGYIARQSLLSASSDASANLPDELGVTSKFQERMIRADFSGSILDRVRTAADDIDVLIWDLADERHGVHRFPDGTIATRSIDTIRLPEVLERFDAAEHLEFGSREHLSLWKAQADGFAALLRDLDLFDRTVVLQVPWAIRTTEGDPSPWSMGVRAADANKRFAPYYAHLRKRGFRMLAIDEDAVLADPGHRWGLAPFHYSPAVYREVIRRLRHEHGLTGLHASIEGTP